MLAMSTTSLDFKVPAAGAMAQPPLAQPRYETVVQFYRTCVDETNRKLSGAARLTFWGAAETLSAFGNGGNEGSICGRGVRSGELTRIFLACAADRRQTANLPRLAGVTMALRQRFSCRPES